MIKFAILRADQRGWSTIRVGVGMSGIVIKCAEIPPFIHYLMTNQNMMPVDLLFTEYFSAVNSQGKRQFGDPRRNVNPFRVLQYNMLEHLLENINSHSCCVRQLPSVQTGKRL